MRILIDLTQVPVGRMGVGSYAENLLRQFATVAPDLSITAVLQSDDRALLEALPQRVERIVLPARLFRALPLRLLFEQVGLPWLGRRRRIDVLHSLHYSLPLLATGAKRVVTMHDMTGFLLPAMHTRAKGAYMRFFIRQAVRRADFLIFVSASALDDCRRWFRLPLANAAVVHHGKSAAFAPAAPDTSSAATFATLRETYHLPQRYILYLGTLEPRKNVSLLLRAFAQLAAEHPEARLVVAGKKGWHFEEIFATAAELNLGDRVVFTGYIDEQDKPALMRHALLFVYPSLHEGFGVPVLEAMASGVPTIAGNRTSIPEIAGDGALLIDPGSLTELTAALQHLYRDEPARATLAARGIAQAAKFSWRKTAEETALVYRRVVGRS